MFSADTPMQHAFAEHMVDPQTRLSLSAFYQRKRDLLHSLLADSPFTLLPSAGSFFMLADYSQFSDERDSELVKRLIVEYGVATIPLSAFYADGTDNKLIRLSLRKMRRRYGQVLKPCVRLNHAEPIPLGYFIRHFGTGQCSKSSRTTCTFRFLCAVRYQTVFNNYAYWDRL